MSPLCKLHTSQSSLKKVLLYYEEQLTNRQDLLEKTIRGISHASNLSVNVGFALFLGVPGKSYKKNTNISFGTGFTETKMAFLTKSFQRRTEES